VFLPMRLGYGPDAAADAWLPMRPGYGPDTAADAWRRVFDFFDAA
jgi:dienelactone hydrolase